MDNAVNIFDDPTCKNCKHWEGYKKWENEKIIPIANIGFCKRITNQGNEEQTIADLQHSGLVSNAFIFAEPNTSQAGIFSKSDFGCTLFTISSARLAELTIV